MNILDTTERYLKLGFGVVYIPPGTKGPRTQGWQKNPVTTLDQAQKVWAHDGGVGLHHASSSTATLDIDHKEHAERAFAALDLDLNELLNRPGPKIVGKNGAKPLYCVPEGVKLSRRALVWRPPEDKPVTVFELRAGNVQDVLPPSKHPETGNAYEWMPHLPESRDDIPMLPDNLLKIWQAWPIYKAQMEQASPWFTPPTNVTGRTDVTGGVIGVFNERYGVREILERNGYVLKGSDRYLSPSSSTNLPGVSILESNGLECAYSHHASDSLADGHRHDAFSVFCILEHGNDVKAAVKVAAAELGLAFTARPEPKPAFGTTKEEKEPRKSQATELVALVTASGTELFKNPDDEPYLTVTVDNHQETYRLRSKGARAWLRRLCRMETGKSIGGHALQDALNDLEGIALYDGETHEVHVRLAEHRGNILLDLGDATHRIVRITPQGWHIEAHSPVKFIRPKALAALPLPVTGGSLAELWKLLNVASEDRVLLASWLVKALTPKGPYPLLPFHGEQGSAKSTTARAVRALVDPSSVPLRSEPRNSHDLMIAATSSWVPTFDNLSTISKELSDAFCVLSTGGGRATRTLYSDDEETILSAQRPVIMTAISDIATRPDLLDRCIILYLPRITDAKRQSEQTFWKSFERAHGRILGSLLTAVSAGLTRAPHVQLTELPRMADFAVWAVACEEALGFEAGSFMARYNEVRKDANELALDTSPLPPVLRTFVEGQGGEWQGSASELLDALTAHLQAADDERTLRGREWPKRADKLSSALRRYAPNLRATGLELEFGRTGKKRSITLRIEAQSSVTGVTSVSENGSCRDARTREGDAADDATFSGSVNNAGASRTCPPPGSDEGDATDATKRNNSKWSVEL